MFSGLGDGFTRKDSESEFIAFHQNGQPSYWDRGDVGLKATRCFCTRSIRGDEECSNDNG